MVVRKARKDDYHQIKSLLLNWKDDEEKVQILLKQYFKNEVDTVGLIALNNENEVIAFLGVFFSSRLIGGRSVQYASLTSFYVDPKYRGKGITYKVIDELKKLGDYVVFAITPIKGTYNIYLNNGFRPFETKRKFIWNSLFRKKSNKIYIEDMNDTLVDELSTEEVNVYNDHKNFNCKKKLVRTPEGAFFVISKQREKSLRQIYNHNILGYFSKILSVFSNNSLSSKMIVYDEFYFIGKKDLFNKYISLVSKMYLQSEKNIKGISVRKDWVNKKNYFKVINNEFEVAPQFVLSKNVENKDLDLLYSEIFVLDL